jgi:tRNA modification GTPase
LAAELKAALTALGEVCGETATEEILERIFSRFCIGK